MADQIKTVSDMFKAIQDEIDAVKGGDLPLDTARTVFRARALQINLAALNLQFQRINRAVNRKDTEVNLLTGKAVTAEEKHAEKPI